LRDGTAWAAKSSVGFPRFRHSGAMLNRNVSNVVIPGPSPASWAMEPGTQCLGSSTCERKFRVLPAEWAGRTEKRLLLRNVSF